MLKGIFAREGAFLVDSIVKWMRSAQKVKLKAKSIRNIQDLMEVSTMWETAVKKHEERIYQSGMFSEKQHILIDQMLIKFGRHEPTDRKIKSSKSVTKLDNALKKFVTAATREEVLKCLD